MSEHRPLGPRTVAAVRCGSGAPRLVGGDMSGELRETRTAVPPSRFESIQEFLDARGEVRGTVEIDLDGFPLHFFYDWRGSRTTFVSFSGTVSAKVEHVPAWAADGISRGLGMNRVLISDPSVKLSSNLRLGWYAGSVRQRRLQEDIARLLAGLRGSGERTLLFGASGGGFAALLQAAVLPGAIAFVSNPQTDITRYTRMAVERYLKIAWGIDAFREGEDLPFAHEVLSIYERPGNSETIYLQNAGDADHIEKHYAPFRRAVHPERHVEYVLKNLGPGHVGPDRETFVRMLIAIRDHEQWDELVATLRTIEVTRNA